MTDDFYWQCIDGIDYSGLEEPYRQSLRNYVERGLSPGSALRFALEGSIKAMLVFRDAPTLERLVVWMHHALPTPIWGSRKRVRLWMQIAQRLSSGRGSDRCMPSACKSGFSAAVL